MLAVTPVGWSGALGPGVTLPDGADAAPTPIPLAAVTVNVYAVPLVRPVTMHWRSPDAVHFFAPGELVTV